MNLNESEGLRLENAPVHMAELERPRKRGSALHLADSGPGRARTGTRVRQTLAFSLSELGSASWAPDLGWAWREEGQVEQLALAELFLKALFLT